jgi:hypothetical protein
MPCSGTTFEIVDIDSVWSIIEPRLFDEWCTDCEDVRNRCRKGRALCLACEDGVTIVTLKPGGSNRLELFVLLAVGYQPGAFKRQEAALLSIARDLEADTLAFTPRRKGWRRLLGREWSRKGDKFVREVPSGR